MSNHVYHSITKHLELDLHFVREQVNNKEIQVQHVPSIDIFTKPLSGQFFVRRLRNKLGVLPGDALELRGRERELRPMHAGPVDTTQNPNPSSTVIRISCSTSLQKADHPAKGIRGIEDLSCIIKE